MKSRALLWAYPVKCGSLFQQIGEIKSWKRRYFVLKDAFLFYFKGREDMRPSGVILLEGSAIHIGQRLQGKDFVFTIHQPKVLTSTEDTDSDAIRTSSAMATTHVLAADDAEERDGWIKSLQSASLSQETLDQQLRNLRREEMDLQQQLTNLAEERVRHVQSQFEALAMDVAVIQHSLLAEARSMQRASKRAKVAVHNGEQLAYVVNQQKQKLSATKEYPKKKGMIQTDIDNCNKLIDLLLPKHSQVRRLKDQVDGLTGTVDNGESVPSISEIEATLRSSINKLAAVTERPPGRKSLPDEARISTLFAEMTRLEGAMVPHVTL